MDKNKKLLEWALELHSLAQAGLYFGSDAHEMERLERIREISAEMISHHTEIPLETVKSLFCKDVEGEIPEPEINKEIYDDEEN
ncbi:MAG: NUDIX hydrolase N-terminal domain-containing protein [Schaedlerella sp.]|nr:NUDIX hydrolase N-terminal domain-containing protein [Schaedlerella sp.]